jgi:cob(I)alamin adenosyltransferase
MTKIYTKTGDKGQTGLIGGERVWKDSLRIESYGTVDELNASIGLAVAFLKDLPVKWDKSELENFMNKIQNELFDIGSQLANNDEKIKSTLPQITSKHIQELEKIMDKLELILPPLKQFILPGGHCLSAFLHQARCVCRRAERKCVELSRKEKTDEIIVIYLNRLSDTLFVLARWANQLTQTQEIVWNAVRK